MTKQFARCQFFGERSAIDGNKCFSVSPAAFMNFLSEGFFAAAGFPVNDHTVTGWRDERNLF